MEKLLTLCLVLLTLQKQLEATSSQIVINLGKQIGEGRENAARICKPLCRQNQATFSNYGTNGFCFCTPKKRRVGLK